MIQNFKGWHVLGASFTTAMLMAGATFYSFQHFVTPIEAEFGLSRDQVNLGMIAFLLSSAMWAAIVGKSITRINPRLLALLGICLLYTSPSPRDKRQSRMPSSA